MEIIRSAQNATIRHFISIRNHRRRRAASSVLVDGVRQIARAIQGGLKMRTLIAVSAEIFSRDADGASVLQAASQHAAIRWVTPDLMRKVCFGDADGSCVAEFESPQRSWDQLPDLSGRLILVLDQVEKPGNLGAVFRTANAAGVGAVLLCDCPSDPMNPNVIRSSLGAVFTTPYAVGSFAELEAFFSARHPTMPVYSMRVESAIPIWKVDFSHGAAVILGAESTGLADRWRDVAGRNVHGITIPMSGQVDSFNVSVSAAFVAYESMRQRISS